MIYIEKRIDRKIFTQLMDVALRLDTVKFSLWKYSNQKEDAGMGSFHDLLQPFFMSLQHLEPATTYSDDPIKRVNCFGFSLKSVELLIKNLQVVVNYCDSITLYRTRSSKWVMCIIFHENMTLLRVKRSELKILKEMGLPSSNKPPSWW